MDLNGPINIILGLSWPHLIFQLAAIIFSVGYLGYALIYHQQLIKMAKNTLVYEYLLTDPEQTQKPNQTILHSLSLLQLLLGAFMLIMSLFLLNLA